MIEKGRWPPATIFCGPSGVGKFLIARAVAQKLICGERRGCGDCPSCRQVEAETSGSLLIIQPESTQIKVHQAREVVRFMYLKNLTSARVVIINEAHRLNPQGANSLLKTLEEPPENSHLILVAPTLFGILPTIRSRSQLIRFTALRSEELAQIIDAKAPQWILSLGRADLAQEWLDLDEEAMMERTYGTWSLLLSGDVVGAFEKVKVQSKDIEEGRRTLWLWQQMLKAAWYLKWGRSTQPWTGEVVKNLSELSDQKLSVMALGLVQLEKDLLRHLDGSLCFENYFYKVNDLIFKGGGAIQ